MKDEIILLSETKTNNFNSINHQKHINSSMSLFLLIFIFKIVSVNTFHLEYPIGRGGFGKVSKIKINIFS